MEVTANVSESISPYKLSALQMLLPLGPPPQVFKTTLSTLFTKGGFKTHQALRLWEDTIFCVERTSVKLENCLNELGATRTGNFLACFEHVSVHRRNVRLGRKRGVVPSIPRSEGWRCSKHELDSCLPVLGEGVGPFVQAGFCSFLASLLRPPMMDLEPWAVQWGCGSYLPYLVSCEGGMVEGARFTSCRSSGISYYIYIYN